MRPDCWEPMVREDIEAGRLVRLDMREYKDGFMRLHANLPDGYTAGVMPPTLASSAWRRSPPQRPAVHRSQSASARAPNRPGARRSALCAAKSGARSAGTFLASLN